MNNVVAKQEAKSGELVDKSVGDLLDKLDQIEKSLGATKSLMDKATEVEEKGRFKAMWSGISGKSDKELASIVKGLGANVKVTQEVVKFLIELAQHKSTVQEGFLGALDKKIEDQQNKLQQLHENDGSLDENAKQVETAVLTLYKQVHAQVESEVKLRNNVDQNMANIGALFDEVEAKGKTDAEQSEQIAQLIRAMREKTFKLEELRISLTAKEEHLNQVAQEVEEQSKQLSTLEQGLEQKAQKLEETMGDIQANTAADKLREQRIVKLEADLEVLSQRKIPQKPAFIAIGIALTAVIASLYSILL